MYIYCRRQEEIAMNVRACKWACKWLVYICTLSKWFYKEQNELWFFYKTNREKERVLVLTIHQQPVSSKSSTANPFNIESSVVFYADLMILTFIVLKDISRLVLQNRTSLLACYSRSRTSLLSAANRLSSSPILHFDRRDQQIAHKHHFAVSS